MRELIYQTLTSDPVLNLLGITDSSAFSVDVDTPQVRPFLQLRWGVNVVGLSQTPVTRRTVTIWVHDNPGDYAAIDAILARIRYLLPELAGVSNGLGHVVAVEWTGDSEDLADDGHQTITRNAGFSLVGSGQ